MFESGTQSLLPAGNLRRQRSHRLTKDQPWVNPLFPMELIADEFRLITTLTDSNADPTLPSSREHSQFVMDMVINPPNADDPLIDADLSNLTPDAPDVPVATPTSALPSRPQCYQLLNTRLEIREQALERLRPLNGLEWANRNAFLDAQPNPMMAIQLDVEKGNPYGQLWEWISFHFLGRKSIVDFYKIQSKEFDHAIGRNFTSESMKQVYYHLANANGRHGMTPPPRRRQRRPRSDSERRVPLGTRDRLRLKTSYRERRDWSESRSSRIMTNEPKPRTPYNPITDWLGKHSSVIIWHLLTILLWLGLPTSATPRDIYKKIYLEDEVLSVLQNVPSYVHMEVPINYLLNKTHTVYIELNNTGNSMSINDGEMANLRQSLIHRANTSMISIGPYRISEETMLLHACRTTCDAHAGILPTIRQLLALNGSEHTALVDITFNRTEQNVYAEVYHNLVGWKTDLFRLINTHELSIFKDTDELINSAPSATHIALLHMPSKTIRFRPSDTATSHCVCRTYRSANVSEEIIDYLADARLENDLFRAEIRTLQAEALQILNQFHHTHARVLSMVTGFKDDHERTQRQRRNILSSISQGFYNLIGVASEHDVLTNTQAVQTTTNNVAILRHYLQAKDRQTIRYRQRIDSVARTTQQELVSMTNSQLSEHLETMVNNRRLLATHYTGSFRNQITHLHKIADEYLALTQGVLPQTIQFRYKAHLPSVRLEDTKITRTGVSFQYTYQKVLGIYRTRRINYLPIAADKHKLVYYCPEEIIIIPRFSQNNDKPSNSSDSVTINMNEVTRSDHGYATTITLPPFTSSVKSCTEAIHTSPTPSLDISVKQWCNQHTKTITRMNYTYIKQVDNVLFVISQNTKMMITQCDNDPIRKRRINGISYSPIESACSIRLDELYFNHSQAQSPSTLITPIQMLVPDIIAYQHKHLYDETAKSFEETQHNEIAIIGEIDGVSDEADLAGLGLTLQPPILIGTAAGAGLIFLLFICCIISCICCPTFRDTIVDACFCVISAICCTCIKCATNPVQIISRNNDETTGNIPSPQRRTTLARHPTIEESPRGGDERDRPTFIEGSSRGGEERRATFPSTERVTSNPINVKRPRETRDELSELTDVAEANPNQDGPVMRRPSAPIESPPRRNSEDPASFSLPSVRHARPGFTGEHRLYSPRPASQGDSATLNPLTSEARQFFLTWRYSAYDDARKILEINVPCIVDKVDTHLLFTRVQDGSHQKGVNWCHSCREYFDTQCKLKEQAIDLKLLFDNIPSKYMTGKNQLAKRLTDMIRANAESTFGQYMAPPPYVD